MITWAFSMAIRPISLSSQDNSPKDTLISVNNSGEDNTALDEDHNWPVALVIAEPWL